MKRDRTVNSKARHTRVKNVGSEDALQLCSTAINYDGTAVSVVSDPEWIIAKLFSSYNSEPQCTSWSVRLAESVF